MRDQRISASKLHKNGLSRCRSSSPGPTVGDRKSYPRRIRIPETKEQGTRSISKIHPQTRSELGEQAGALALETTIAKVLERERTMSGGPRCLCCTKCGSLVLSWGLACKRYAIFSGITVITHADIDETWEGENDPLKLGKVVGVH